MALSKEDRVTMSKKIVEVPEANAVIDGVILQILAQRDEAIKNDNVNMALQQPYTDIINKYQPEYNYLDGNKRTELTEDTMNDAAKGVIGNGFFLADPQAAIPSVPTGIWTFFSPMAFTWAIGKNQSEQYPVEPLGEIPTINTINNLIAQIETFSVSARATGTFCLVTPNPTPPPPTITTQEPEVNIQALLNQLKNAVTNWKNSLNAQKSVIPLDEQVVTRLAQNQAAYDVLDPTITLIESWQIIQDWASGSCPLSESWGSYANSKLNPNALQIIKDTILYRQPLIDGRINELISYFGTINQNPTTGILEGYSGWYGERYLIIDSRINMLSGSANGKYGAEKAIETQNQIKAGNELTGAAYSLNMVATLATAPGLDTNYLNVQDASGFNVGDRVYVVADKQEELSGSVEVKEGNRVKLTFKVPKKYTLGNYTRIYKMIEKIL
jgi:hypothetical protein